MNKKKVQKPDINPEKIEQLLTYIFSLDFREYLSEEGNE